MSLVTFGATALRLSPPGRERIETTNTLSVSATGLESNAAAAAVRVGADTVWLSHLPDSTLGRRVEGILRDRGIEVVATRGQGRQGLEFAERGAPPRSDHRIEDIDGSAVTGVDADRLDLERIDDAGVFYTTSSTMARSPELVRASATCLKRAADAGVPTAFGLFYREGLWSPSEARETVTNLFPAVDTLVTSERAVVELLGRNDTQQSPQQMVHSVASEFEFDTVAMVRGERGGIVWEDRSVHEQTAPEVETVDASGADDAFAGVFLARRLDGAPPEDAVAYATAAATMARTTPGNFLVASPAELRAITDGDETL